MFVEYKQHALWRCSTARSGHDVSNIHNEDTSTFWQFVPNFLCSSILLLSLDPTEQPHIYLLLNSPKGSAFLYESPFISDVSLYLLALLCFQLS